MSLSKYDLKKEIIYENFNDLASSTAITKISIIHFNDVYNIESRSIEPVGGASRFLTAIEAVLNDDPSTIVLFSGDAFNPSMLSILWKGKQMVDVLNTLHINAACIGNHDFDFGIDHLSDLISGTNFPWMLSNVLDIDTEKPLANANLKHIIECNGLKIGLIGMAEEEWICSLSTIDYEDIIFQPCVEATKSLANELKTKDKCDIVIALTHMRMPNDIILVEQVPEIDLVLGGHDHDYNIKHSNGKFVLKSGCDFKEFSLIDLYFNKNTQTSFVKKIHRIEIDSSVPESEKVKNIVDEYLKLEVPLGVMNADLDGRFLKIRTEETNLGNFMCDIIMEAVNADCVIINSGTFRSDTLHPKGEFKVKDLKAILPFLDTIVMIASTGKEIYDSLENSVSQLPKLDGRFLQVAGICFTYDLTKPSGKRVDPNSIKIQNETINFDQVYLVATKQFLKEGKDGYEMLKNCKVIIDDENGPLLISLIENHLKTIEQIKTHTAGSHRPSIVSLAQRNKLIFELSKRNDLTILNEEHHHHHHTSSNTTASFISKTLSDYHNAVLSNLTHDQIHHVKQSEEYKNKMNEYEEKSMSLKPIVDGRIICLNKPQEKTDNIV